MSRDRLPNLVIIGVGKAGTTSLFRYLAQHPDICASEIKELNHFAPLRTGGEVPPVEQYAAAFSHCERQRYRLEASPAYCYGGEAVVAAVRQTLVAPKILVSLRDPVARLWSAFTFLQSLGRLPGDMSCDEFVDRCLQEEDDARRRGLERRTPLSVGRYADYLGAWLDEFGDDAKVVFAEHLFADPRAVVSDLLRWLDLDDDAGAIRYGAENVTVAARSQRLAAVSYRARDVSDRLFRSQPAVRAGLRRVYRLVNGRARTQRLPDSTRARLEHFYADATAALAADLLARGSFDLPPWLATAVPDHHEVPAAEATSELAGPGVEAEVSSRRS